jgi:hypothetical protein
MSSKAVQLRLDGLDTFASVQLNGQTVLTADNFHRSVLTSAGFSPGGGGGMQARPCGSVVGLCLRLQLGTDIHTTTMYAQGTACMTVALSCQAHQTLGS